MTEKSLFSSSNYFFVFLYTRVASFLNLSIRLSYYFLRFCFLQLQYFKFQSFFLFYSILFNSTTILDFKQVFDLVDKRVYSILSSSCWQEYLQSQNQLSFALLEISFITHNFDKIHRPLLRYLKLLLHLEKMTANFQSYFYFTYSSVCNKASVNIV